MEHLYKAYDMLDHELKDAVKDGHLEKFEDIHLIKELSGGMKNLKTVIAMNEAEGDYSMDGGKASGRRGGHMSRDDGRRMVGWHDYDRRRGYSRDDEMDKVMQKIDEIKQTVQHMGHDR